MGRKKAEAALAVMEEAAENERAVSGGNNPPELTPFEQSRDEIDGLVMEARNWLTGDGVVTEEDADAVSQLKELFRKAITTADERRKAENKPFDEGKAEVQARYAPLIADTKATTGAAVRGLALCNEALTPYLKRKDDAQRAAAAEAQRIAAEKAAEAAAAMQASRGDLEARERAEEKVREADRAAKAASAASKEKAHATGGSRAVGLSSSFVAEVTDMREWARHAWATYPDDLDRLLRALADGKVAAGLRSAPGLKVEEVRRVR